MHFSQISFLIPVTSAFIFLILIVLFRQVKTISGKILAAIFLLFGMMFLLSGASRFPDLLKLNIILFPIPTLDLLLIPLIYLYFISLTEYEFRFKFRNALHFLPAIILLSYGLVFWFTIPWDERVEFIVQHTTRALDPVHQKMYFYFYYAKLYGYYLQFLIYYILMITGIFRHKKQIKNDEKLKQAIGLNWFAMFLLTYFIYELIGVFYFLIPVLPFSNTFNDLLNFFFISFLGYFGLYQANIFQILNPKAVLVSTDNLPKTVLVEKLQPKSQQSLMSEELVSRIESQLLKMMEEGEVYTDCKINIQSLAQKLNTNKYYLSQVIREQFNKNFTSFINEYRVKRAQALLSDEKNDVYTLESIGKMAGFNSKPPFYEAFKKISGQTPSEFRKEKMKKPS